MGMKKKNRVRPENGDGRGAGVWKRIETIACVWYAATADRAAAAAHCTGPGGRRGSADGQPCRKDWSVGVVTGCRDDCVGRPSAAQRRDGQLRLGMPNGRPYARGVRRRPHRYHHHHHHHRQQLQRDGRRAAAAVAPFAATAAVVVPVARGLRRADDGCETRGRVCAARRPEPTAADPSRRRQWTRLFGRRYRQTDGARGPRHLVCIYSDAVALPARTTPAHAPRTTRSRYRSPPPPHGSVHSSAPLRAVVIPALAAIAYVRATLVVRPPARSNR